MILRPLSSSTCASINARTSGRPLASGYSWGSISSSLNSKSRAYLTASLACSRASARISRSLSVKAKLIIGRSLSGSRADQSVEHGQRSGVAVPHLQRQIADVAVSTENLHAPIGDDEPVISAVALRQPRVASRRLRLVEFRRGPQHHPAHRLDSDMHVREFEGDALLFGDRLFMHDAFFRVG